MQPKSGYKTTEFLFTIIPLILAILVTVGVFTQEEATTVEQMLVEIVATAGTLAAAIVTIVTYIRGRVQLKKAS